MINTLSPPTFLWLRWSSAFFSITEHIDFATPIQQPAMEPVCNGNLPTSMHTLDHLQGVSNRASLHYTGESQLTEVSARLYSASLQFLPYSYDAADSESASGQARFFCLFQMAVV